MRTTILIGILASVQGIQAACDDACASAVTGIGEIPIALMSRTYDCELFLRKTVTPSPAVTHISTSVNMQDYANYPAESTAHYPIPAYASACAADADYSSACSCASVTTPTLTLPTPTVYTWDRLPACENAVTCAHGPSAYSHAVCGNGCGACVPDSEGNGYCVRNGYCEVTCQNNSDCPSGICLSDTCCGNTCYDPGNAALCANWQTVPSKLFKNGIGAGVMGIGSMFGKLMERGSGPVVEKRDGENKMFGDWTPPPPTVPTGF
ncbi:small secreted protein [Rutstroemia sp. NJR-2017a WRK4]|nr:small secreted protein [Rutstroemia sp. NJR-2017a WRK4]